MARSSILRYNTYGSCEANANAKEKSVRSTTLPRNAVGTREEEVHAHASELECGNPTKQNSQACHSSPGANIDNETRNDDETKITC